MKYSNEQIEDLMKFYCDGSIAYTVGQLYRRVGEGSLLQRTYTDIASPGRLFTDSFRTNDDSEFSAGETIIEENGQIIWIMQHQGRYKNEVIRHLKDVLWQSYSAHRFIGGRGAEFARRGDYLYINRWEGDFTHFSGKEEIIHLPHEKSFGYHEYQGQLFK